MNPPKATSTLVIGPLLTISSGSRNSTQPLWIHPVTVYSLGWYTSEDELDRETPRGAAPWLGTGVTQIEMHVRMNRIAKVIRDMIGPPFLLDGVRFIRISKNSAIEPLSLTLPIFYESLLLTSGFFPETKKDLHRHPVDSWLEYTNFMKIGQPKLSDRN